MSTEVGELPEYHEIVRARDVLTQIIEAIEDGVLTVKGIGPFLTEVQKKAVLPKGYARCKSCGGSGPSGKRRWHRFDCGVSDGS